MGLPHMINTQGTQLHCWKNIATTFLSLRRYSKRKIILYGIPSDNGTDLGHICYVLFLNKISIQMDLNYGLGYR
jgi:hypothetical protein